MRASRLGIQTAREFPADADNLAQAWLIRGGYLYRHAAGIYSFTGLAFRVLRKVSCIIEEEVSRHGGSQVQLPVLQSADLWQRTGRWARYEREKLMFHLQDRKGSIYGLAPTAEEAVLELANHLVRSPTQLPLILFQQNLKFRDELRPRSGLLRAREFVMMDAYSFDMDAEGLDASYRSMVEAYHAVFRKIGIEYIVVQADSGPPGGSGSQAFMAVSETGEDRVLCCDDYAANLERASSEPPVAEPLAEASMEVVDTPNAGTIEEVAALLSVSPTAILKTLVYDVFFEDRTEQVVVCIRGDCQVNEVKLANHFGAMTARPSEAETVERVTGIRPGFIGPVGLPEGVTVVADHSLDGLSSLVCGVCRPDKHAKGARPGRDFELPPSIDVRLAREGENGPTGKPLQSCRGIELGRVSRIGRRYSQPLDAGVLDSSQTFRPFEMGSYRIATTRLIAAIVDQNCSKEGGIRWPVSVAPFHVHVIPLKVADKDVMELAERFEREFEANGIECLLDDRKGSAGSKLKDSDIIGLPFRVVLGRGLKKGVVEVLDRIGAANEEVPIDEVVARLTDAVSASLA